MHPPTDRPSVPAASSDLELLRAFEPIVKYTRGEQFYPMDVERYIEKCSLWVHYRGGREELLVPEGELTIEKLVQPRSLEFGAIEYLRFVPPQSLEETARALREGGRLHRQKQNVFVAGQGRLARGGLLPRLADALFSATLLLRGRVPAAVAAQAELIYNDILKQDERYVYYGRVVRQGGWTVLQYWFFLAYNSWRSGFHGVNDHESDWEMILLYLYELDGQLYPEWVGYASHDFHGDDLRRRWDDRGELDLDGSHPVVYAGAGSHASYFRPGEYQAEVPLPLPGWLANGVQMIRRWWRMAIGVGAEGQGNPLRIPFVDYARGDGLAVGPGQSKEWTPALVSEATPWASEYRGLWGLYARDPISGENAPAGPMYNRDGSPRPSWYDPLGFGGLDKVPPPPLALSFVEERIAETNRRQIEIEAELAPRAAELQEMGVELEAMRGNPHLAKQYEALAERIEKLGREVKALRREHSENDARLASLNRRAERLRAEIPDDPRAHIVHLAKPVSPSQMRFNRLIEFWAAVSISFLLIGLVLLILFARDNLWIGVGIMLTAFVLLESILRGTYITTITSIAILLSLATLLVFLIEYWQWILIGGLIAVAVFLLVQKVREVRG